MKFYSCLLVFALNGTICLAQNSCVKSLSITQSDSLNGFDKIAAKNSAISEGFIGTEFPIRMYHLKRDYINAKYNIKPNYVMYNFGGTDRVTVAPACVNEDFEASPSGPITNPTQISGWLVTGGSNSGVTGSNCSLLGCCPNLPSQSAIIQCNSLSGFTDGVIGAIYPIYSVFGTTSNNGNSANTSLQPMQGNTVFRLNNSTNDFSIEKLSKTFAVTASNALFQFAYISVFYNGHSCCDAGSFQVRLSNATLSSTLACPGFSLSGLSASCSNTSTTNFYNCSSGTPATNLSSFIYNNWRIISFDLSSYIGQNITIDFIATDCTGGAHYGYTYIDAQCSSLDVLGDGNPNSAIGSSVTISACSSGSIALALPSGLGPYTWAGSSVVSPYNTPLVSNQNYTASAPGLYTLTMNPEGACVPITKTIIINNGSSTIGIIGTNSVCIGSSTNFTLSGATAYSLNLVAITSSTLNVLPLVSTSYSVSGINSSSCIATGNINVTVNNTCTDVWPGDANSDGICDNLDVLELGLHFTLTGPLRTTTSNLWQSYFSNNWIGTISNGKNVNHSDCNGDGVINGIDALAILSNYNSLHSFKQNFQTISNSQLNVVSDQISVNKGNWGSVSINLADSINPITNINGIAFTLGFDKTYLEIDSVNISYPVSFLNPSNQNFDFKKTDFNNSIIYTASTHTNNLNVNGNGKIATFYFKVSSTLAIDTVVNISITQANKSNSSGVITPLTSGTVNVLIIGASVNLKDNYLTNNEIFIYPNPTKNLITIKSKTEMQKIEILSITGQVLSNEICKNKLQKINLNTFAEGVYFLKIYDTNGLSSIKLLIKE